MAKLVSTISTLLLALFSFRRCSGRCNGLDDFAGGWIFARNSSFCSDQLGYMECNFQCKRQTVMLNDGITTNHPLVLESAARLHVPPLCVSWITIRRSARVSTVRGSYENRHCGYWLRLEDSDVIGLEDGIVDLSTKDSAIEYINLSKLRQMNIHNSTVTSIDHAEIEMYPSTISKSRIKDIFFMNITVADLKVSDTTIETIGPGSIFFNGFNLTFENVSIRNLKSKAINMLSGKLVMKNCSIEKVSENAIVGGDARIDLSDVAIGKIVRPGFDFNIGAEISFKNVTVKGHPIEAGSNYIHYPNIPETQDLTNEVVITGFSNEHCEFVLGVLNCDFTGVKKPVVFERNSLPLQLEITISNARMLRAVGDFSCAHITVFNSSGIFISHENATCPSIGKLLVTHSNLSDIVSKMAYRITIESSVVSRLHVTSSKILKVHNSVIVNVYDVKVEREATWSGSHFLQVSSLELRGLGSAEYCKFDRIFSMELNLNDASLSISNSTINSLPQKRSVLARSGMLSLTNVTVQTAAPSSVYLEEKASLTVKNVTFDAAVFGVISVSRLEQVIHYSKEGTDFTLVTQKRTSFAGEGGVPPPPGAYLADIAEPYCHVHNERLVCDYTRIEDAVVVVMSNASQVTLREPSSVILRPTRAQSVAMNGVKSLSVDKQHIDPELDVLVTNSTFANLTAIVHTFMLDNTSVNLFFLPPEHTMMSLTARNCKIKELVSQTQVAQFFFTRVGTVRLLTGDSVLFVNSSVGEIASAGVEIRSDGFFDSTEIGFLEERGIVIHGVFTASNITINNAEEKSIVVHHNAALIMRKVTFENCSGCPFVIFGEVRYVSDLKINGVLINTAKELVKFCGGNETLNSNSEWRSEDYGKGRKFWVGLALASMISLFVAATILLVVRTCRSGSRLQMPLVSWRNSSETVLYSGLKQDEPPQQRPTDDSPENDSEKSRLVRREDEE